jgi:hypothetical protein
MTDASGASSPSAFQGLQCRLRADQRKTQKITGQSSGESSNEAENRHSRASPMRLPGDRAAQKGDHNGRRSVTAGRTVRAADSPLKPDG